MERRKDKNNRVLKDGESYREKEHRYMYRWVDGDKKRHCTYAQTLRELRKKEAMVSAAPEAICAWMMCTISGKRTRSV